MESTRNVLHDTEQHSAQDQSCPAVNVGSVERVASILAGGGLALAGLRHLNSLSGIALTALGGSLVYRGMSGHCMMYQALGMNTAEPHGATAVPAQTGERVEKSIIINRPPHEVFQFWRKLDNLPLFMENLKCVTLLDENRSHWVAEGPLGKDVEWDAEVFNERENEMIAWRSLPGSQVETAGSVHFVAAPGGRGTEVVVALKYNPPGGKIGIGVAKLFRESPEVQIQEDLCRLKRVLEAGELPTTLGQSTGRPVQMATAGTEAGMRSLRTDEVAEASDESFPASDPPSWTATTATERHPNP